MPGGERHMPFVIEIHIIDILSIKIFIYQSNGIKTLEYAKLHGCI